MPMLLSGKIVLKGNFKNTGFGFSCLQYADRLHINGNFKYQNEKEVEIIITGEKEAIQQFYRSCIDQNFPVSGELSYLTNKPDKFREFQIINQL